MRTVTAATREAVELAELILDRSEALAAGEVHNPLERLWEADRLSNLAHQLRERFAQEARAAEATWDDIGDTLGVTRQAAHARFHNLPALGGVTQVPSSQEPAAPAVPDDDPHLPAPRPTHNPPKRSRAKRRRR